MGFHTHLKLIRRCPSQPFQENLHTILTPEHKAQFSLRISPFVIFSTPKRQVGLCKLCPFLPVTKQSWFTDLNHLYKPAATRAAAIEKRFPKTVSLESVLQEKLPVTLRLEATLSVVTSGVQSQLLGRSLPTCPRFPLSGLTVTLTPAFEKWLIF